MGWRFLAHGVEGQPLDLHGVNVWAFDWKAVPDLRARVKDPLYRQEFLFGVFEIHAEGRVVRFAAGEFSANVWGFYVEE
jgi:hypothetical protein